MNLKEDLLVFRDEVVSAYTKALGGIEPSYHIKDRPDGEFMVFEFAKASNRFYEILSQINERMDVAHPYKDRLTIANRSKKPSNLLGMPEVAMLQHEVSASLTVDKDTFGSSFLDRYTPSVTDLETQIVVHANHVIYGRRGSGKSSLLAYAMHHLKRQGFPYAWVAMQTYASRSDSQAIASVLSDVFSELARHSPNSSEFELMSDELLKLGEADDSAVVSIRLMRLVSRMRKMLGEVASASRPLTIFLDDLHVVGLELQPDLLNVIYSLARGNSTYIKISGIEQLTNLWDGERKRGLESPHDVQTLMLDHNLTSPDQSRNHIQSILDKHAAYCALPGISYISADDFLDRLVLSAAAVPRDALSLFIKSIARSILRKQKAISITSLNAATSEAIEEKLKDVQKDVSDEDKVSVAQCLEEVKRFCLVKQKKNAFLVKIANSSPGYLTIQKLVALRFVHLLHGGITPHKAGERFIALMLDFGFYIGIRAARSVVLVPEKPRQLVAKELRTLPILTPSS